MTSPFQFSGEEREMHLRKFEVLLMNPTQVITISRMRLKPSLFQVDEFEKMFQRRMFDISEPLFHAWLSLKFAVIQSRADDVSANNTNILGTVSEFVDSEI